MFLGHAGSDPQAARHHLDPWVTRAAIFRTPRIVITARMPRGSNCLRPDSDELPEHPGILLPDPRSDDAEPPGDRGLSYRSGIYYVDEEQKRVAEDTIADVDASGLWDGKVVTEVQPVGEFWEAEPDHQDYLEKRPGGLPLRPSRLGASEAPKVDDVQPAAGPRRNRLHCRCHCAGPVRNLRDRVVQRRGHRTSE